MHNLRQSSLAFIDIEATGLDACRHEIIAIGVVKASQPDLTLIREWGTKVIPEHIENADKESLTVAQYDTARWRDAMPLRDAITQFNEFTSGCVLMGHNISFDWAFLSAALNRFSCTPLADYHRLDTLSIAFAKIPESAGLKRYRLHELAEYFKIPVTNEHDALADARRTYEVYKRLAALP
ncbi:MAG: 3'-5' exonuclease [Parcubacteria group bacterium]|nr:3'-5' exonuclease [Parcubacteria group bacterium]